MKSVCPKNNIIAPVNNTVLVKVHTKPAPQKDKNLVLSIFDILSNAKPASQPHVILGIMQVKKVRTGLISKSVTPKTLFPKHS